MEKRNKEAFIKILGVLSVLTLISGAWVRASEIHVANQTVSMQVAEMCMLQVNGNQRRLIVNPAGLKSESLQGENKSGIHIQYSCLVGRNKYRTLSARLESSADVPSGCSLKLHALPSSKKNEGMSTGQIILSDIPQALITDIGSCATGTGATDGALLIYSFSFDHRADLSLNENKPAVIILTFVESF